MIKNTYNVNELNVEISRLVDVHLEIAKQLGNECSIADPATHAILTAIDYKAKTIEKEHKLIEENYELLILLHEIYENQENKIDFTIEFKEKIKRKINSLNHTCDFCNELIEYGCGPDIHQCNKCNKWICECCEIMNCKKQEHNCPFCKNKLLECREMDNESND